ncbi:MAG: hypothetical protein HND48_03745 [Chloroflexi bacterium]|nr:hypothetical protein [Chloroflexota bacterium]
MLADQLYERLRDAEALSRWVGLSESEFDIVVGQLDQPITQLNAEMKARSVRFGILGLEYKPFSARESLLMVLLWSRLGLTNRAVAKLFKANGWTVRRRIRETREILFQLYPELQTQSTKNGVRPDSNSATMLWSALGNAVRGSHPQAHLRDAIDPDYESYFFEELEGETAPIGDDRIPPLTETRLGEGMQTLYRRIKSNTIPIESVAGGYFIAIVLAGSVDPAADARAWAAPLCDDAVHRVYPRVFDLGSVAVSAVGVPRNRPIAANPELDDRASAAADHDGTDGRGRPVGVRHPQRIPPA